MEATLKVTEAVKKEEIDTLKAYRNFSVPRSTIRNYLKESAQIIYRRVWNEGSAGNQFYLDHYKGSVDILLRYDGKPAFDLRTKALKRMAYQFAIRN
jgi:hypothetical protein